MITYCNRGVLTSKQHWLEVDRPQKIIETVSIAVDKVGMNHQVVAAVSKRIADYFIVVDAGPSLSRYPDSEAPLNSHENPLEWLYSGIISDRYPAQDRSDYPLPPGIPGFCFPKGIDIIEEINSSNEKRSTPSRSTPKDIPAGSSISTPPSLDSTKSKSPPRNNIPVTPNSSSNGLSSIASSNNKDVSKSSNNKRMKPTFHSFVHTSENGNRILGCCLTFYERISSSQVSELKNYMHTMEYSKSHIDALDTKTLYMPRCICLISHWPFASSFKQVLAGLYKIVRSPSSGIPIERYICNFIDDVPSPPAGRVDITYYLNDQAISFRCPAANEPNAWCGLSLFPLFECLSPENILSLFALVVTERQVLLISSQLSLLSICAEAVTSLMYPLTWTHCYIPILPLHYIGVLQTPTPFIIGIPSSFLASSDCCLGEETVCVYLDENRLTYGSLGPPPALPERRYKKMLAEITEINIFGTRGSSWNTARLPCFDDAFSTVSDKSKISIDETLIRSTFLKFFVAILKNYRRHLNYKINNASNNDLRNAALFNTRDFINENPSEWHAFLSLMIETQSFSHFIDERVLSINRDRDIIFFDESIDAKMNRYTFKFKSIDTPFLLDETNKHAKTYVPPTPNTINLPPAADGSPPQYTYHNVFPTLDPSLFAAPCQLSVNYHSKNMFATNNLPRLKRVKGTAVSNSSTAIACTYSCYVVALAQFIIDRIEKHNITKRKSLTFSSTTPHILDSFGSAMEGRRRSQSSAVARARASTIENIIVPIDVGRRGSSHSRGTDSPGSASNSNSHCVSTISGVESDEVSQRDRKMSSASAVSDASNEDTNVMTKLYQKASVLTIASPSKVEDSVEILNSAKVGIQVAFETLNALSKLDDIPDDLVYRALIDACGTCGLSQEAIDLILHMYNEGMLPDKFMLNSINRAFASDERKNTKLPPNFSVYSSEGWTTEDWQAIQMGPSVLSRRKIASTPNVNGANDNDWVTGMLFGDDVASAAARNANNIAENIAPTRWSHLPKDGHVPELQWSSLGSESTAMSTDATTITGSSKVKVTYPASSKLKRQMTVAEDMLRALFPDLHINLTHELGTTCPNRKCSLKRPLTIGEIYRGWDAGNPNKYTTKCIQCGTTFVPRFCVTTSLPSHEWIGSEGPGTPLWCELLSPWTLRKEVFNVIFEDGVETLTSAEFRKSSIQNAIVFWNIIVAFRIRGLPYSFLLSAQSLSEAFPPRKDAEKVDAAVSPGKKAAAATTKK